jgi:hypothetical protein
MSETNLYIYDYDKRCKTSTMRGMSGAQTQEKII